MQGFNMGRYVPPDVEGTTSGNRLHGKHPLGARASKLASHGALTVRFEMPYAVWCSSCPKPTIIGQGVRFNAHKKRAGAYFSTPIWSFTMRHADCGGAIEMRTDPQNTAYVVVSGAVKRDTGEDRPREGDAVVLTDAEREALRQNAFASLEKTIEDREQAKRASARIDELVEASARHWDDPYAQNQKLRAAFRQGRHARERDAAAAESLQDRMSLGIDLLPASEDDARRAALVDFGALEEEDGDGDGGRPAKDRALAKPLFGRQAKTGAPPDKAKPGALKTEKVAAKRKQNLVSELMGNTRAATDPFLVKTSRGADKPSVGLPGVKRKRPLKEDAKPPPEVPAADDLRQSKSEPTTTSLVDYDSDQDSDD